MTTRGDYIYQFITEALATGRTVYASTYLVTIAISKKHLDRGLVRVRDGHCEVARGKRWDSINGCSKIFAE